MATTGYLISSSTTTNTDPTTFTPTVTLVGGAGNTVPQYTTNNGFTVKVGKIRWVEVYLTGDGGSEGAGTGQMNIALPEAAASDYNGPRAIYGNYINGGTTDIVAGQISASGTTIALGKGTGVTAFTGADQNSTTRTIIMNFWYRTAA